MKQLPKGHLSCLNPAFRYINANSTSVAETFRRVRERLEVEKRDEAEREVKVKHIKVKS